jgi:hypothetical protein
LRKVEQIDRIRTKLGGVLPMPTDLQTRTQYLALAEFCQSIISPLCDYAEGTVPLPTATLEKARAALESVTSGDPYRFGQRTAAALGSYEQVRTLEEVWRTPQQINGALELTVELLGNAGGTEGKATSKANELVQLFLKLQARALWNFEQPKQTAPPDVGELCRALKTA